MPSRYVRTAAGQAEIQARTRPLSRPVRNLLLVINDSRSIEDWLVQVNGITPADVALLRTEGLIAEVTGPATAAAPKPPAPARLPDLRDGATPSSAPVPDADWVRTQEAIRRAGYNALYEALTAIGKAKLGLMRGYRFTLEIEKCNGADELRALALKFADQLRAEHGMGAVGELTSALGAVKA